MRLYIDRSFQQSLDYMEDAYLSQSYRIDQTKRQMIQEVNNQVQRHFGNIDRLKRKSKRNRNYHSIRSKEYKKEIYNNTPEEYQQSIRYLYNRLEQLDEVMVRASL